MEGVGGVVCAPLSTISNHTPIQATPSLIPVSDGHPASALRRSGVARARVRLKAEGMPGSAASPEPVRNSAAFGLALGQPAQDDHLASQQPFLLPGVGK